MFRHLKETYGPRTCNEMAVNGIAALERYLGESYAKDAALLKLTDTLAGSYFKTAAEGKRLKLVHKSLDKGDWQLIAQYLLSNGMTEKDFTVFAEPAKSLDDPAACTVFLKLFELATAPENEAAARLIPFMTSAAATEE